MAICNLDCSCELVGDIVACDGGCNYVVNGINRMIFANLCDIADTPIYEDYYAGSTQTGTDFPTYGSPVTEAYNRACALYSKGAVNDVIMDYVTGTSGPTKKWYDIRFVDESAVITQSLVGGDDPAANKYISTTLTFTIRGTSQYLQNIMDSLNFGKIAIIVQTTNDHTELAKEVQSLLNLTTFSPDPRTYILGHNGSGFKISTNELTMGGAPDDFYGYSITMTHIGKPLAEIVPLIDSNYNQGGTPTPAGYIASPFNAAPYQSNKPICNLISKLLNGFDGKP